MLKIFKTNNRVMSKAAAAAAAAACGSAEATATVWQWHFTSPVHRYTYTRFTCNNNCIHLCNLFVFVYTSSSVNDVQCVRSERRQTCGASFDDEILWIRQRVFDDFCNGKTTLPSTWCENPKIFAESRLFRTTCVHIFIGVITKNAYSVLSF